mmetsp:Transcript_17099/g.40760  ORF Transcript_17099/g.40760 Transcript_17099/m.40760 type:complete len:374 (+) Transcript_17099:22-1143(+)
MSLTMKDKSPHATSSLLTVSNGDQAPHGGRPAPVALRSRRPRHGATGLRLDSSEALVADDLRDEAAVFGAQPLKLGLERARGDGDFLREDGDRERQRAEDARAAKGRLGGDGGNAGQREDRSHGSHGEGWQQHWRDRQADVTREDRLGDRGDGGRLGDAEHVAVRIGDGHTVLHLGQAGECHVGAARQHHRHIRHGDPQPLYHWRPSLDQLARADGDAARDSDRQRVGLTDLRPLDGGARAVDVVAHDVDTLVQPLPEDDLRRRGRHQHADRRNRVHRHEGRHPAWHEHLLAGGGMDDGVLDPLRIPQVSVRRLGRRTARVPLQQVDLGGELVVADEERRGRDHLAEVREAAGVRLLVVPRARGIEGRRGGGH